MTLSAAADPSQGPPIDRDPWSWWRRQMPVTAKWAYLDHAAVAPLPVPAVQAISEFQRQASEEGDTVWPEWSRRVETLRAQFAALVGAETDEICLMPNTTAGVNLVAEGFPWSPGDSVVVPEGEFPSNLFPWLNQESKGVDVRIVPRRDGAVDLDDLFDAVDESTRIISASWVGYSSGYRIDLNELVDRAHRRGVLVFVDAIQGLGMYPLDVNETPVDFLAADGHKWLLGPEGAGMAMIRREHVGLLRCASVGWNSVKASHQFSGAEFDLRDTAARYEGGSANMIGMAALSASVGMFLDIRRTHGEAAIAERILAQANFLVDQLRRRDLVTRFPERAEHQSGIVTFMSPGADPAAIRTAALEQGIVVSCRGGGVRASLHVYNTQDELTRLADVAVGVR